MPGCPALPQHGAFLSGMLDYVDCQSRSLGQNGYLSLAGSGSTVGLLLGAALTIFIAFIGYRLLTDQLPTTRDAVLSAVRIGVVLLLATSWPAFQILVYDVAMDGPSTFALELSHDTGLPGAANDLTAHLQAVDDELVQLAYVGVAGAVGTLPASGGASQAQTSQSALPDYQQMIADPLRSAGQVSSARTVYLTATIAAFASVRLVAALLLALAPLFALFLLFDGTRGLFEGWVRILVGATLGSVGVALVLGVEAALLEPWLAGILQERAAGLGRTEVPVELLVASLVFATTLLGVLVASAWTAYGFRIMGPWSRWTGSVMPSVAATPRLALPGSSSMPGERDERTRAAAIADAVVTMQRRDTVTAAAVSRTTSTSVLRSDGATGSVGAIIGTPLGQRSRRTSNRVSRTTQRRDRT